MNTRRAIDESSPPSALSVSFNADKSCFSVGLDTGFRIYNSRRCDVVAARDLHAGIGCAEMVGSTNYIALVGGGKQPKFPQNKVIIWDEKKESAVLTMEFRTTVQRVRISKSHIIVVLLNSVNLYKFSVPPQKLSEFETANNPFGLCCLGPKTIIFPGRTPGQLQLVELASRNVSIIPAHSSPLRALELSPDGEVLATAGETGTLIRVWSTSNCAKIGEMRRGIDPATIFSIAISPSSTLMAVTSDKSTLHVFDLPHPSRPTSITGLDDRSRSSSPFRTGSRDLSVSPDDSGPQHKWGFLSKVPMMPRVFSDTYSFASAHFEIGDEPTPSQHSGRNASKSPTINAPVPGVPGGQPPKGVAGWLTDEVLLVVGAGQDARWEKFAVGATEEGKRICLREGWRRYLE